MLLWPICGDTLPAAQLWRNAPWLSVMILLTFDLLPSLSVDSKVAVTRSFLRRLRIFRPFLLALTLTFLVLPPGMWKALEPILTRFGAAAEPFASDGGMVSEMAP